jgi:hypothetical protein
MAVHEKDGRGWVSFPSRQYKDESGETKYQPILRIEDEAKYRSFQRQALAAVEAVMGEGESEDVAF